MSKVYVIGHFEGDIETIRVAANIPTDTEVICVSSVEEIPIGERPKDIVRNNVYPIVNIPRFEPLFFPEKRKGHQRPYKFHR